MRTSVRRLMLLPAVVLCCLVASCSSNQGPPPKANPAQPNAKLAEVTSADSEKAASKELLISAAASTKEVIEALAADFSKDAKNAAVKANPGPSSGLATQIIEGAPADLFLSANREWASKVQEAGLTESSKELLTNKLVLVVPKGNPAEVKQPQDLLSDKVKKIALAGEKVPAGKYADQALTKLELLEKLTADGKIARGQDVRGALSFVERGEAEAGIVYSTDVNVAPNVEVVHEFDSALHDEIVYVLVLLKRGANNSSAKAFYDYLQSEAAEPIYVKNGFTRIK